MGTAILLLGMGTWQLRKGKGWAHDLQLGDSRQAIRTQILLRPKGVSLLCHMAPGWVRCGNNQRSIWIRAHSRLVILLPLCLVEQLSINYKPGLHLPNLGGKVLGAQQRVLSWMGTHSVVMAGMGPPTALDPPSVGMGGAGGPSSPRSISRWPAGSGLGASTRESAGCRHSLQACLPLRGAAVDSICSQVWQGRLIMSEV